VLKQEDYFNVYCIECISRWIKVKNINMMQGINMNNACINIVYRWICLKKFLIIDKSKAYTEAINMIKEFVNSENLKHQFQWQRTNN
jgi:hypothetical protein